MQQTDWDNYYDNAFWASRFTRQYTTGVLLDLMRGQARANPSIIEFGGGNSCFYEAVRKALRPSTYTVVDTNQKSLDMFEKRHAGNGTVRAVNASVLDAPLTGEPADIVFSAGLVEHFDEQGTREAIASHFKCVRPGGLVVITFPTPTWLYRLTRRAAEALGSWAFPDERPLTMLEVSQTVAPLGKIFSKRILWPIVLTQGVIAATAPESKATPHNQS